MQSLGHELLDVVPRQSSIPKDVGISAPRTLWQSGADSPGRCTDVMRYFIDKFPEGYEGWAKERGEEVIAKDYLKPF